MFWSKKDTKDTSKLKNALLQWILQNILENQTFQRIAKFIMVDSYEMDFIKGIVILVKVDDICKPLFIGREMMMELDDQIFYWSLPLNVHTFTTPLLY